MTMDSAPDLILHGGRVYTVDPADRVVEALAIRGGRIAAVGGSDEIRRLAGPGTRQVALGGRAVLPGFIDGHPHMDMVGLGLIRPSLDSVRSIDDILAVVEGEVKRRRPGEWILCNTIGVEPDLFKMPGLLKEGRWPTRHDLDRVAPDNPVYIEPAILAAPGHAFANTAALRLAGITRDTKAPDGVKIDGRRPRASRPATSRTTTSPRSSPTPTTALSRTARSSPCCRASPRSRSSRPCGPG